MAIAAARSACQSTMADVFLAQRGRIGCGDAVGRPAHAPHTTPRFTHAGVRAARLAYSIRKRPLAVIRVRDVTVVFTRAGLSGDSQTWGKTDPDGRFRVDGLVPGQEYSAQLARGGHRLMFQNVVVDPADAKDLGTKQIDKEAAAR